MDTVELAISGVAHGGWCVAREPGGRVVFVRHALPGERVRAVITEASARFARADAVEILTASPDRVEPPCPHARPGGCGGCDWQHATLAAQRRLKAAVIAGQLRRIAGLDQQVSVEPLTPGETGLGWRTRVRYSVAPDGTAGLLAHRSHTVVDVGECPIAHPLVRAAGVTARRWEQAAAVEVAASPETGESAVVVTPRAGRRRAEPGPRYLRRRAAGRSWRVSVGAFWQVHPAAPAAMADAVLGALRPRPGDVALDLYCGAGLFTAALAEAVGPSGAVLGVDADRSAVSDARHNLRRMPWARVQAGDLARLPGGRWATASLAVLDPPRAGVARTVIQGLLTRYPDLRRIAYVSCDPATLARDIAVFGQAGWRLAALRAFDAFPMTHHVECLATLTRGRGPAGRP